MGDIGGIIALVIISSFRLHLALQKTKIVWIIRIVGMAVEITGPNVRGMPKIRGRADHWAVNARPAHLLVVTHNAASKHLAH